MEKQIYGTKAAGNESNPGASVPEGWGKQEFRPLKRADAQNVPAWTAVLVISLVALGCLGLFTHESLMQSAIGAVFFVIAMVALAAAGLLFYFLPAFIAFHRKHPSKAAILVCDLLFGWTFLGWGIALVWSLTGKKESH